MGPVLQFVLAVAVATTTLVSGSLAWPRFTTAPRPRLLEDVRTIALKTTAGVRTAQVLGVTDEAHVTPINMGEIMASASGAVKGAIRNRIQTVITVNALNQLSAQFDNLPDDQKAQIQEVLCKPAE